MKPSDIIRPRVSAVLNRNSHSLHTTPPTRHGVGGVSLLALFVCLAAAGCSKAAPPGGAEAASRDPKGALRFNGVTYWNDRVRTVPWSIHVVKIDRSQADLAFTTTLARNTVFGLSPLRSQIRTVSSELGKPLVGINGDFYDVSDGPYSGDPRGLQIMNGEYLSSPGDQAVFWLDSLSAPHIGQVESRMKVTWPDGSSTPLALNEQRGVRNAVLYTPRLGPSTRTASGRDWILAREGDSPWLPLAIGKTYRLKVTEEVAGGNAPLKPDRMVLSVGSKAGGAGAGSLKVGDVVQVSTETEPSLAGSMTALGAGNIMVKGGVAQTFETPANGAYKFRSVVERHPRSAVGYNASHIFLVQVDGRQPELSVGMTLQELGAYMLKLGCEEAVNFDGGGSATLWVNGDVVNSPCNGSERDIGNGLVLLKRAATPSLPTPARAP